MRRPPRVRDTVGMGDTSTRGSAGTGANATAAALALATPGPRFSHRPDGDAPMSPPGPGDQDIREGETAVDLPAQTDAGLFFIGRIRTPWHQRADCPKRGSADGPVCTIEIDPRWQDALAGIEAHPRIQVLYWMDRARRDLVVQNPGHSGTLQGTFALRSPVRPNPIASSEVWLEARAGSHLLVRGLDCLDGTPLLDLKPVRN